MQYPAPAMVAMSSPARMRASLLGAWPNAARECRSRTGPAGRRIMWLALDPAAPRLRRTDPSRSLSLPQIFLAPRRGPSGVQGMNRVQAHSRIPIASAGFDRSAYLADSMIAVIPSAATPARSAAPASSGTYGVGLPVSPTLSMTSATPAITTPMTAAVSTTTAPSQRGIRSTCRQVLPTRHAAAPAPGACVRAHDQAVGGRDRDVAEQDADQGDATISYLMRLPPIWPPHRLARRVGRSSVPCQWQPVPSAGPVLG